MVDEPDGKTEESRWESYYRKVEGREPRALVTNAMGRFEAENGRAPRSAIDLGCGDGTETVALLEAGWRVLAIDGQNAGLNRLRDRVRGQHGALLETRVSRFEDVILPPADLIHASLSIPFCRPDHFDALWRKITDAIVPRGRFAGQLFGVRDSWAGNATMTFHTEAQARSLFDGFEVESFHERDEDGQAVSGPKHWHIFTIIARKPG